VTFFSDLTARLESLVRRGRAERDTEEELRFHVEMEAQKNVQQGMPPEEAQRRARLALGGVAQTHEAVRDARGVRLLEDLARDFAFAWRQLRRTPGFAFVAVLTLALGIGANTAIFSIVDGVLLRPAPFDDLDRLMVVWETDRASGTTREPASIPDFADFQQRSRRFQHLAAFAAAEVTITPEAGDPGRVPALAMTHGFLPMLGLRPLAGRVFLPEEDAPGAPDVVVISEALGNEQFGGADAAIGASLRVNDVPHTIIGVLPRSSDFGILQMLHASAYSRGFADRGGRTRVDLWLPLRADPARADRGNHPIIVLGRLAADATPALAAEEMGQIAADLERLYPQANDRRGTYVEPVADVVFGPVRPALLVLLGAVALVLLVACSNVANLLLARGAARVREVTVRAALGASMARLTRQFLVESAVLTLGGAALGVLLAWGGLQVLLSLAPSSIPRIDAVTLDGRVLGASLALSMLVAFIAGLVPTLQARRLGLAGAIQGDPGRTGTASREHRRTRSGLVVLELALAVMLMVGAGLLIRSLWRLQGVDPGFASSGVLKAEFQLPPTRYPQSIRNFPEWPEVRRFHAEVLQRLENVPGVTAVTIAGNHPLDGGFTSSITVVGREAEAADWPEPSIRRVDEGYVGTLGVPLVSGRPFSRSDDASAPPVLLINAQARRRFFSGREPLGQQISLWGAARTVVGVVGDERFHGQAAAAPPAVYMPTAQAPVTGGSILVRTAGDPRDLAPIVRRVVQDIDAGLPLFGIEPLEHTLANSNAQRRFTMLVLGAFAGLALVLAIVGVHGVLSYTVVQRSREIGIRMALGADRRQVRSLVLGEGAVLAGLGLLLGTLGALALSGVLRTMLYGVGRADPGTLAGVAVVLGGVALLASWAPARRAAGTDPTVVLKE
jgi:putative ABC transport system permease protein